MATALAPTDKQINFVVKLAKERVMSSADQYAFENLDCLDRKDVSGLIDRLMKAPKVSSSATKKPYGQALEVGVYKTLDGVLLRVYKGQQSGMNLVKKVIPSGSGYDYEYVGSAHRVKKGESNLGLAEILPLTKEEAANWGHLTGSCIVCGKRLDDPESVDRGIGPVCFKKF